MDWTSWRDWLLVDRGLALDTVATLDRHRRYMTKTGFSWATFLRSPAHAAGEGRRWLAWKKSQGDVFASVRLAQRVLNHVAAYRAGRGRRRASWALLRWKLQRAPSGAMQPFSPHELEQLHGALQGPPFIVARIRALIWLCLHTGLRRGEIWAIRLEDAAATCTLHVRHPRKGGPVRHVALPEDAWRRGGPLESWLRHRGRHDGALWETVDGAPISRAGMSGDFWRLTQQLGFPVCFNRFRRTHATILSLHRVPLERIQHRLGHTDPRRTVAYIFENLELQRDALVECQVPGYAGRPSWPTTSWRRR